MSRNGSSEPRATRVEMRRAVKKWRRILGLMDWEIAVTFGKDESGASATCLAQPEYRTATLLFDLSQIPQSQVERFAAHELSHAWVWPLANAAHSLAKGDPAMEEWVRTEEERLTTALEHILTRLT